jgi:hypothetical protein
MRLYSYIVRFDDGFAPCFSGAVCTLACCKPKIRAKAQYGDWIAGVTPKDHGSGRLIYLMRVERAFTFAEYSKDRNLRRRVDNIYRPRPNGGYIQEKNDYHGPENILKDLSADRVLLSKTCVYFGKKAPAIPRRFRKWIPRGQGHRVFGNAIGEPGDARTSAKIKSFVRWALSYGKGRKGRPFDLPRWHEGCST